MDYKGILIAVRNMEESKRFYKDILGLDVVDDFGANVMLQGGIFLQTLDTWVDFIKTDEVTLKNNATELYFETDEMDELIRMLDKKEIVYVHPLLEHSWGQRGVRIYDPDYHIIEISETISNVIERFISQGLTLEEIAIRMDVGLDYIKETMKGRAK